tara:strand:+ start:2341 stop:4569 length:2229 start_codon:yes stop_codon:yes gene_type:complete
MALTQIKFAPGIDKQDTSVGATGRWTDSDLARFRYGLPEKIGGWQSLLTDTIVGVARAQHSFVDKEGNRYVAIGTDKFLLIYFEGQLFDITPFKTDDTITPSQITFTNCTLSIDSTSAKTCTITSSTAHGLEAGNIILFNNVTLTAAQISAGLTDAQFEDKLYQVLTVPNATTFTINSLNQSTATVTTQGTLDTEPYTPIGPSEQSYGYGYGLGQYGGSVAGAAADAINMAGNFAAAATSLIVDDSSSFPSSGTLLIDSELMTYTTNTTGTNTISGISRGAGGTTDVEHLNNAVVTNATIYNGWGSAVNASQVVLEPGLWSLNNYGDVLVATVANGKTYTWNTAVPSPLAVRASQNTAGLLSTQNPTKTRLTLVSPTTRHLIHFGTLETLNTNGTWATDSQDDMFIRFSTTEDINTYDILATNTAGSQRLQDGTKIVGALIAKENILVWTDNALYTMKFVGAPFTFGFEQVGTNCGLIGKNAAVEIDGVAYWMSNNGLFAFDGTVNSLPCSVEDYVFDDIDTTKGQQICAGLNNLFTEVTWWYPTTGSDFNNRSVTYNYGEAKQPPLGTWYTNTNANFNRTSWMDTLIYPQPYSTSYTSSATGTFPDVTGQSGLGQTTYFAQETGNDQINPDGSTTTLASFIQSFSFSLQPDQSEVFLSMRRFLPNFKVLTGNNQVTVGITDYPAIDEVDSPLSPFTVSSSTTHVDTRARGRYANLKLANTASGESWRFGTFQVDIQPDGRR